MSCAKSPVQICSVSSTIHTTTKTHNPTGSGKKAPKVAVVLSGCGVYDGSEIHESSAVLVHLSRAGAKISMFAPNKTQFHTINHTKGETMEQDRNVLIESARIARGKISPLAGLNASDFDAVIFPGGFGAAKNLSSFATEGAAMKIDKDVERVIKEFHLKKKPIGLCCISPVLAAKVIPGVEVTVGNDKEENGRWPYAGTAEAIRSMGATHIRTNVHEAHTDTKHKVITTAAFMCDTGFHDVYNGIGQMVDSVLRFINW